MSPSKIRPMIEELEAHRSAMNQISDEIKDIQEECSHEDIEVRYERDPYEGRTYRTERCALCGSTDTSRVGHIGGLRRS